MSQPTHQRLKIADVILFDLMEWDNDMRTWERQVIRDARSILRDRMTRTIQKNIEEEEQAEEIINNGAFGVGA